ncbi:uncharacterized protein LOC129875561 [Solanum dulcamara]|uniref:uncharacterized protein LOC129875561 n=1 Tax=Solanum dulcamara TaxID=45834 RepID=UPI002486C7F6|nr:uncharacterized protein LOC129875561 [Solanum dulcamara]
MCQPPVLRDCTGCGGWSRSILIALSAKNKVGFIDGTHKELASVSPEFKLWNRYNDMVLSWLLNSLSKEIADKGSNDIADYFTKIKILGDELDALNSFVNYLCDFQCGKGKIRKMAKSIQDERLIQFIMGLNNVYAVGKSNIPSANHDYSILMQDENKREVYMSTHYSGNSASFLATNQNNFGQRSRYYEFKGKKTAVIYSHCKKPWHFVDKCYKIIGFPSDFKFTKAKRFQGSVKSIAAYIEGTQG